jgi:hypothetical protein
MADGTTPTTYYVAACGARKLAHPAPAALLYTGSARLVIDSAAGEAARDDAELLILSALHGLIPARKVIAPYDVRMGQAGSITVEALADQLLTLGAGSLYAFCPKAYRLALCQAAEIVNDRLDEDRVIVHDVFEAAPGIGYQRGVATSINRTAHLFT